LKLGPESLGEFLTNPFKSLNLIPEFLESLAKSCEWHKDSESHTRFVTGLWKGVFHTHPISNISLTIYNFPSE